MQLVLATHGRAGAFARDDKQAASAAMPGALALPSPPPPRLSWLRSSRAANPDYEPRNAHAPHPGPGREGGRRRLALQLAHAPRGLFGLGGAARAEAGSGPSARTRAARAPPSRAFGIGWGGRERRDWLVRRSRRRRRRFTEAMAAERLLCAVERWRIRDVSSGEPDFRSSTREKGVPGWKSCGGDPPICWP